MRPAGRIKMGYYPTPPSVVDLIRQNLIFPDKPFTALDPCCGEGAALAQLTANTQALTFGVELDKHRAEAAKGVLHQVIYASVEETVMSRSAFSLMLLNPPYDSEKDDGDEYAGHHRKEFLFLLRLKEQLAPGGGLVYIIPHSRLDHQISAILSNGFQNVQVFRFPDGEFEAFGQIVVFATRNQDEQDSGRYGHDTGWMLDDISRIKEPSTITQLSILDKPLIVPNGKPPLTFKGRRIDPQVMDQEVSESPLWIRVQEASRANDLALERPPLPLHSGHLALLLAAGMLDGVVGEGDQRHIACGLVRKTVTTTTEINDDGAEVTRDTEHFQVAIKVLDQDGEIQTLT
jgi:methylase of polypeptide subunit release factors